MPVVINDFEVLPETPRRSGEAARPAPSAAPALRPEDVKRLLRRLEDRRIRLIAH